MSRRCGATSMAALGALAVAAWLATGPATAETRQFTFSWPFEADSSMRPRGGSSSGAPVTLLEGPSDAWRALQAPELDDFERDRRAILAMAGGYRTSFDFIETVGFAAGFEPARPYQSWGTEYVYVIEDRGDFISLQHIMVMFVLDADGNVQGPIVQKHWRQDWQYEDTDLHVYTGRDTWAHRELAAEAVRGRWSQAVFQVDDSPRYEGIGTWEHAPGYASWISDETWRPLPRRESSVRSDYDVLVARNRHTITPSGWVHEEENLKAVLDEQGRLDGAAAYVARELGVNRYELIVDFDFSAGDTYWEQTHAFWADVRSEWARIYASSERFRLLELVDGRPLFVPFFEYAAGLEAGNEYDADDSMQFVRETLDDYVERLGE